MGQHESDALVTLSSETLLEALHEPALLVDGALRVVALNEPARARLGEVRGSELLSLSWPIPWESLPGLIRENHSPTQGPVRVLELGELRLILLSCELAAPEELRRLLLENRRHAALSAIASGAAHEINNPLGGIVQSVQLLQRALDLSSPRTRERLKEAEIGEAQLEIVGRYLENRRLDKFTGIIQEASGRVTDLVAHVLGFARRSGPEPLRQMLSGLLRRALFLASVDNDMRKLYLFRDIPLIQPSAGDWADVEVEVEPNSIILVLLESLKLAAAGCAARRESAGESYKPEITIELTRGDGRCQLDIRANGRSLPPDVLSCRHLPPEQVRHIPDALILSVCRELAEFAKAMEYRVDSNDSEIRFSVVFRTA